jgi:ParB family chromosome partitioning protein
MVAVTEIAPHPANFRRTLTDLDELAESIARQGLTSPLEVMPADRVAAAWPRHAEALAGYAWVLLSGHRRLAAARRVFAGAPEQTVPVLVRHDGICEDPVKQLDLIATDDSAHRPFNPIEQAHAFQASVDAGRSQRQIAERYGCAQGHVSRRLSLLLLPEEIQQAVGTGRLGVNDALKLARLDDQDDMRAAWRLFLDQREDAWITSVDQAITEHADRAAYQARRRAALSRAGAEGLPVVDPVEEFGRDLDAHRLAGEEDIGAARAAGALVAAISGNGELEYYTTGPAATTGAAPAGPGPDQRRAAAAARERAGRLLAAQQPPVMPPAAASVVDTFLRTAPDGWRPIAQRWLRWLRLGPATEREPARWWEQIYTGDWDTRVWAAHCLALAGAEHRARTHREWDRTDLAWVWRLVTDAGYLPRPWERHRLDEVGSGPGRESLADRLPADAPPGWFGPSDTCRAITWLTGAGMAWLERDPQRFHEVEQLQRCGLEVGHPGPHAAHVQDAGAEHYDCERRTGVLALWAWWSDDPEECHLRPADTCPVTRPGGQACQLDACLLFAGHPGRHC